MGGILIAVVRRLLLSAGVLALIVAAVVAVASGSSRRPSVARSPHPSSFLATLRHQANALGRNFFSPRLPSVKTLRAITPSNRTCSISGGCSLDPCVDPIASPPMLVLNGTFTLPGRRSHAPACSRRKATVSY